VWRLCPESIYRPRRPTTTPFYPVVQHHLETFFAQATQGDAMVFGPPVWVERSPRAYLRCGILAHAFARAGAPAEGGPCSSLVLMVYCRFDHTSEFDATEADAKLDRRVTLFGQEFSEQGMWILQATHLHGHLGQLIAYARMNGVVPPWSR
jgi:hypothetical protein